MTARNTEHRTSIIGEKVSCVLLAVGMLLVSAQAAHADANIAAPTIDKASGLHEGTQTVTISPSESLVGIDGQTIYYTLNGSNPSTTTSAIYSTPLTIATSTTIKAIASKSGYVSDVASSSLIIVPNGFTTDKYYSTHMMVAFASFISDKDAWLEEMKGAGYNLIWAHLDDYDSTYATQLASLMDAADRVGGIKIIPGVAPWFTTGEVVDVYEDTWDDPALFEIDGTRVYAAYDFPISTATSTEAALTSAGFPRSQYYLWASARFPATNDGGATWVASSTGPDGYARYSLVTGADLRSQVEHLYNTRPMLDGLINFAVDQGYSTVESTNNYITDVSLEKGKFSMAGISAFYASVRYTDFGFTGIANLWDDILERDPEDRAMAVSDTTANDYGELSYMSPNAVPAVDGLSYIPPRGSGFTLGDDVRYPLTDHSGIQKFTQPWVEAFLENEEEPIFDEDRLFAWYWLHPLDVSSTSTIPAELAGYAGLDQAWWDGTVYNTGSITVGGTNQATGISNAFAANMNTIRVAAHLSEPARLRVNGKLSPLFPAGPAYFDAAVNSFRGAPTFEIVRDDAVLTGEGEQAITDNIWPAAWNFLASEIDLTEGPDIYAPEISNIEASVQRTSTIISFETDEPTTAVLEFGLSTGYGETRESASLSTRHRFELSGLQNEATYHFRVHATDSDANVATSSDNEFVAEGSTRGGSSGGGGGGSSAKKITERNDEDDSQNSSTPAVATPAAPGAPAFTFSRDLSTGSTGDDVKLLQNVLIEKGLLAAGSDTGYFGPLTQEALRMFQAASGISPATGYFGPLTRTALSGMPAAPATQPDPTATVLDSVGTPFTRDLSVGSVGPDVRVLQQFLNAHGFAVAQSGAGSSGLETDYFGPATQRALAAFQNANGISPATGYFGPLTRNHILSRI